VAAMALGFALLLAGGCATSGEKMVESFSQTRKTVAAAQAQVDATLVSLHALRSTRADDLKEGFRRYEKDVEKLEAEGADSRRRASAMQEEADAHIKAWQDEMKTLKDAQIKGSLEDRREAVRSNFKLLKLYAQDARKAYGPFLAGNKEMVRALSIDLSPAAIQSLSPSIDRVLLDGKALQEKLAAMQHAMDNIAAGVSPIGETQ
jgi:chromosome segregation ATPase